MSVIRSSVVVVFLGWSIATVWAFDIVGTGSISDYKSHPYDHGLSDKAAMVNAMLGVSPGKSRRMVTVFVTGTWGEIIAIRLVELSASVPRCQISIAFAPNESDREKNSSIVVKIGDFSSEAVATKVEPLLAEVIDKSKETINGTASNIRRESMALIHIVDLVQKREVYLGIDCNGSKDDWKLIDGLWCSLWAIANSQSRHSDYLHFADCDELKGQSIEQPKKGGIEMRRTEKLLSDGK